jgi:hypothetical protein
MAIISSLYDRAVTLQGKPVAREITRANPVGAQNQTTAG